MSNIINVKEDRNVLSFEGEVFDLVANSTNFHLRFSFEIFYFIMIQAL